MEKFTHLTIKDAEKISQIMEQTKSDTDLLVAEAMCLLIDFKNFLLEQEEYEKLQDLKYLEDTHVIDIPFLI
jgi:hypothetical protein